VIVLTFSRHERAEKCIQILVENVKENFDMENLDIFRRVMNK
jgi:ribosomal protein L31E